MNLPTAQTVTLRCAECLEGDIHVENKAFVTRPMIQKDGVIAEAPWDAQHVSFDDGPGYYVCRCCGQISDDLDYFLVRPPSDEELRKLAKQQYASDEIEIDGDAKVSRGGDPGAFVAAWVWVAFPQGES